MRNKTQRGIIGELAAVAVAATLAAGIAVAGAPEADAATREPAIYMCPSDEGEAPAAVLPCVWDAKHRGNGIGRSFIIRRDGVVFHVTHQRAHRLMVEGR